MIYLERKGRSNNENVIIHNKTADLELRREKANCHLLKMPVIVKKKTGNIFVRKTPSLSSGQCASCDIWEVCFSIATHVKSRLFNSQEKSYTCCSVLCFICITDCIYHSRKYSTGASDRTMHLLRCIRHTCMQRHFGKH